MVRTTSGHHLATALRHTGCRHGQRTRLAGGFGAVLHALGQLLHGAGGVLQAAGGLLGAAAQVLVAQGHLAAGALDAVRRLPHLAHQGRQRALHAGQRTQQVGRLVLAVDLHGLGQVALGDGQRQVARLLHRGQDGACVHQRQRHHHHHHQAQRGQEQQHGALHRRRERGPVSRPPRPARSCRSRPGGSRPCRCAAWPGPASCRRQSPCRRRRSGSAPAPCGRRPRRRRVPAGPRAPAGCPRPRRRRAWR